MKEASFLQPPFLGSSPFLNKEGMLHGTGVGGTCFPHRPALLPPAWPGLLSGLSSWPHADPPPLQLGLTGQRTGWGRGWAAEPPGKGLVKPQLLVVEFYVRAEGAGMNPLSLSSLLVSQGLESPNAPELILFIYQKQIHLEILRFPFITWALNE